MRISSQQIFNGGVNRLQDLNTQLQKTQQQISTGKRVINPSDDPVAAARLLKLDQQNAQIDQYQRGIDLAQNRLEQEESTLSDITDVIQRVRELTVQAGNGSLSADDRKSISSELKERLEQLAGYANTRDASGEYIFSGFKGNTPAFAQDDAGKWSYQGDEGQRMLEIDTGVSVPISDSGKGIFVNVNSASPSFRTESSSQNTNAATISSGFVYDQDAFGEIYPDDLIVKIDASGNTFTVTNRTTGEDLTPLSPNNDYTSGDPIRVAGVQFEISGAASGDEFFVKSSSKQSVFGTIEKLIDGLDNQVKGPASASISSNFAASASGAIYINGVGVSLSGGEDSSDLAGLINGNQKLQGMGIEANLDDSGNILLTSQGEDLNISAIDDSGPPFSGTLVTTGASDTDLDTSATPPILAANFEGGQEAYDALVADSLKNLDNAQESILTTQTEIGGRLNTVDSTRDFLSDSSIYTDKITSKLRDVDYAEAVSTLSFQSFVLQAAQQSFAQVSQLSLFDRI
ncbi:flagellar hook-associated protein FlgL [Marinobacter sp. NFXS9]|uniref:flagellar hook-associated protein FlgL n=1 Tax=Marinobacter sp. NFXS9 TaxID=2818433 RepID=UPI0032DEC6EC